MKDVYTGTKNHHRIAIRHRFPYQRLLIFLYQSIATQFVTFETLSQPGIM